MQQRPQFFTNSVIAVAVTAPFVALFHLATQAADLPFPPYDLFDGLTRILPGSLITFGIDSMVEVLLALDLGRLDTAAKTAERIMAVLTFIVLATVAGAAFAFFVNKLKAGAPKSDWTRFGIIFGGVTGILFSLLSLQINTSSTADTALIIIWLLVAFLAWGFVLAKVFEWSTEVELAGVASQADYQPVLAQAQLPEPRSATPLSRRRFLVQVGAASATITVTGTALAEFLKDEPYDVAPTGTPNVDIATRSDILASLEPAPGTRPEYTLIEKFYRTDINIGGAPSLDEISYRLPISGLVENEVQLSLDDLRADYEAREQFATLSCISNRVGGGLIGTTLWTGVSMQHILETVQPLDTATHIKITSLDGFYEFVSLDVIREDERVMLAYEWDHAPLTPIHGFPLRIYIPDRYGMKQPKWIEKMEFVDRWEEGYWVKRGWSQEAIARATSVIDTVATEHLVQDGEIMRVPIGGIAWSGARGISKVEVRVDDGEWLQADLREPLSETTWVIWRFDWEFTPGRHEFTVRCVEGDGVTAQIQEEEGVRPNGATGYDTFKAAT